MSQKTSIDILLEAFPPEIRPLVKSQWSHVPPDVRIEVDQYLHSFEKLIKGNPGTARDILKIIQRIADPVVTGSQRLAIIGPTNSGKSTLYNNWVLSEEQKSEISPVPGTTTEILTQESGPFQLVDTPGVDNPREKGAEEKALTFSQIKKSDYVILLLNAEQKPNESHKEVYQRLIHSKKPFVIALNKCDILSNKERASIPQLYADFLGVDIDSIHQISAFKGTGTDELLLEISAANPKLIGQLGSALPEYRVRLAWQAIRRATIASGLIALTPIPFADMIPLTAIQASLVLTLSKIYNKDLNLSRVLEIGSAFGIGWIARQGFHELVKFAGTPGWILAAGVAISTTLIIGYTSMYWFKTGNLPSKEQSQNLANKIRQQITDALKSFIKKPDKQELSEQLEALLPTLTEELEKETNTDSE